MPRARRIIEIGSGAVPKKIHKLAAKHPHHHYTGVDPLVLTRFKSDGRLKPHKRVIVSDRGNIELHEQRAEKFLKGKPENYWHHAFAQFTLFHIPRKDRVDLFRELHRVLTPGGKFVTIEDMGIAEEVSNELKRAGFVVHVRSITPVSLLTHDSDFVRGNAQASMSMHREIAQIPEVIPPQLRQQFNGAKTREEFLSIRHRQMQEVLRNIILGIEKKSDHDTLDYVRRMAEKMHLMYSAHPYAVIHAKKNRPKS